MSFAGGLGAGKSTTKSMGEVIVRARGHQKTIQQTPKSKLHETLELPGADPVPRRAYVKAPEAQKVKSFFFLGPHLGPNF